MGSGINLGIIRSHKGNENYLIEVGKNIDVKNVSTFLIHVMLGLSKYRGTRIISISQALSRGSMSK